MNRRIKIGVFGAWRGQSFISLLKHFRKRHIAVQYAKNEQMLNMKAVV